MQAPLGHPVFSVLVGTRYSEYSCSWRALTKNSARTRDIWPAMGTVKELSDEVATSITTPGIRHLQQQAMSSDACTLKVNAPPEGCDSPNKSSQVETTEVDEASVDCCCFSTGVSPGEIRESDATCFSKTFFFWVDKLIYLGHMAQPMHLCWYSHKMQVAIVSYREQTSALLTSTTPRHILLVCS